MKTGNNIVIFILILITSMHYARAENNSMSGEITITGELVVSPCTLSRNDDNASMRCWIDDRFVYYPIDMDIVRNTKKPYYLARNHLSIAYVDQREKNILYRVDYY